MGGGKRRTETKRGGGDLADKLIMNQIMLRFRPIAPRPVTAESSAGLTPVKEKRTKRKYVRVKKKTTKNKKTEEFSLNFTNFTDFTNLTMKDDNGWMNLSLNRTVANMTDPKWISFDVSGNNSDEHDMISRRNMTSDRASVDLHDVDLAMTMKRNRLIESWITVESVIGTCTDEEIWKDLETDRCPGFISNGCDEVQWVNLAYRRMVDPDGVEGEPPCEVVVWLGVKVEKEAFEYWSCFSCRVRVVYVLAEKEKKMQMTVPCDVWKMDSGGYAWRLDVKAALSLGRLS